MIFGVVRMIVNTFKKEVLVTKLIINLFKKNKSKSAFILMSYVNDASIDTCCAKFTKQYVTAIIHPAFKEENFLIVEEYDDEITAKTGHEKWVKTFEKWLPQELKDVTNNKIYKREYFE
jgi:hypothetical protein